MKKYVLLSSLFFVLTCAFGAMLNIDVTKQGIAKQTVAIKVGNAAYVKSLKKNLELSGLFVVQPSGTIAVSGGSGAVTVDGAGQRFSDSTPFTDDKSAHMAARKLADAMCEAYGHQKGFASRRVAFVRRKGPNNSELAVGYPDGMDLVTLPSEGAAVVGPRWKNESTLFYTYFKHGPQIWEANVNTGSRKLRWKFNGFATGATISPDGSKVAVILSFQGSPNLYVIDLATEKWRCLTPTPNAVEGEPSWSPDGRSIVYVSDESRHPQLYIVDLATGKRRRITSRGSQNVNPDWGRDGRITYVTSRGAGTQIAVLEPAEGDANAMLVGKPGRWEHPSWAVDSRHVVAENSGQIYIVDTLPEGDEPVPMVGAKGKWITPSWSR